MGRKRDGSVAELRLFRLVDRLNVFCLCSSKASIESIVGESRRFREGPPIVTEAGLVAPENEPVPLPSSW